MASGDTLLVFTPRGNEPPVTNFARIDLRNAHLVLDFDDTTTVSAGFGSVLPRNYAGGGLTVTLVWMATSATTGDVRWDAAIERHQSGTDDLDADSFAAAQSATATAPATSGAPQYTAITFTNGAQIDSLTVGESFRLRVSRNATSGLDTMTGDAELLRVELRES